MRSPVSLAATRRVLSGATALAARVTALEAALTALAVRVAQLELAPRDRRDLAALLPIIFALIGSEAFTIHGLHAYIARGGILGDAMRNTKALGRLFGRGAGINIDGLVLQKIGAEASGVIYQICRC